MKISLAPFALREHELLEDDSADAQRGLRWIEAGVGPLLTAVALGRTTSHVAHTVKLSRPIADTRLVVRGCWGRNRRSPASRYSNGFVADARIPARARTIARVRVRNASNAVFY